MHIVRLDVRHIDEGNCLGRLRADRTFGQHAVAIDRIVSDETLRFALSEGEFDRGFARVDLQVRVEILRADLELVGRAVIDADRSTPPAAILVAVGDVAIFGRIIIGRHGRGVAASLVEGPVAAIVAAQHIDVIVRLFVAESGNDPEAVVEIVAENCGARRLPTRNLAALAALDVAGQREALLEVKRIARLEVDDPAKPAFEQRCIGRFEDLDPPDQFRRHAFETVVAVIIAFADLVDLEAADEELAVQQRDVLVEPADADFRTLPVFTVDLDTRQALERFRDILVGEFADVFRRHRFDDEVRIALGIQRVFKRCAKAGDDDDVVRLVGGLGPGVGCILRQGWRCGYSHCKYRRGSHQGRTVAQNPAVHLSLSLPSRIFACGLSYVSAA